MILGSTTPARVVAQFHNAYPGIWRLIDLERGLAVGAGERRASDIFLDAGVAARVVSRLMHVGALHDDDEPALLHRWFVPLAAWRVTQQILHLESGLLREIVDAPIPADATVASLRPLPCWCPYIVTPGLTWLDEHVHGFFATWHDPLSFSLGATQHLRGASRRSLEMRPTLLFAVVVGDAESLVTFELPASGRDIENALSQDARATVSGTSTCWLTVKAELLPIVKALYHVCRAESGVAAVHPLSVPTKDGPRFVPPDSPSIRPVRAAISN